MKLLYITFIDFGNMDSGSGVRPVMMYKAFESLGVEIKLLECQQNKRKERKQKVQKIMKWLDTNTPDFCYVEPATGPFFNWIDLTLLKKLHKKGVPVGYYYRDVFWKFPKHWGEDGIRKLVLTVMHKRDLLYFERYCDVMYFSGSGGEKALGCNGFKKVEYLPPGGNDSPIENLNFDANTLIYIGGTSTAYGGLKLIEAVKKCNDKGNSIKLIFVTPPDNELDSRYDKYNWLEIVHTFDRTEIENLYKKATFAVIPFKKEPYMDIAIPIKLYEYIGFGMPIIATNCHDIVHTINEFDCGVICNDDVDSLADCIESTMSDYDLYALKKNNSIVASYRNRWTDRAEKVIKDLTKNKIG